MSPPRKRRFQRPSIWLLFGLVSAAPRVAGAFERQWHLGGGVGGLEFVDTYSLGPAMGLHAAYGLSDMFDVRFEHSSSLHEWGDAERTWLHSAVGGLTYKVDVIEWVPYFGVLIGFASLSGSPAGEGNGFAQVSLPLGLDYGFSRSLAVGLELSTALLLGATPNGTGSLMARLEYRWGW